MHAKLLGWIFTPICLGLIIVTLLVWHPLIALSRPLHAKLHQWIIEVGNFLLLFHLHWVGGSIKTSWPAELPPQGPVVLIANHQSFFDIPICIWHLRRYHPRFVAKRSLGRGFPSVSYVLRTGGSALIDRGNPRQAVPAIKTLGRFAVERGLGACIFPEGTRARDGALKPFKPAGIKVLLEAMPDIPVVPVAISGAWQLMRYSLKPIPFGTRVHLSVLPALARAEYSDEAIIAESELRIRQELERLAALGR